MLIGAILAMTQAGASPLLSAGSPATPGSPQSHVWYVAGNDDAKNSGGVLLHLAPRTGEEPAADGAAKVVTLLRAMPEAIAAFDRTVYLIFRPQRLDSPGIGFTWRRGIQSVTATRSPIGTAWTFDTFERHLRVCPAMPGDKPLLGVVAQQWGPVALVSNAGHAELLACGPAGWSSVELPPRAEASHLIAGGDDEVLIGSGEPGSPIWIASLCRDWNASDLLRVSWRERPTIWPTSLSRGGARLLSIRGDPLLVCALESNASIELWRLESPLRLLRAIADDDRNFVAAPMDDAGRLAFLRLGAPLDGARAKPGAPRPVEPTRTRLLEISATSGEVLYDGPILLAGAVSSDELRLIAFAATGAMLAILMYAMRPAEASKAAHLPDGFCLATPSRRVLAGGIDAAICLALAAWAMDEPARSTIAWITQDNAWNVPLLAAAIGACMGTIGEGVWERTPGKAICSCRVIRVQMRSMPDGSLAPVARAPGVRRAMIRNVVRWFVPPLAIAGVFRDDRRHRGDRSAATFVVQRFASDEAGNPGR
jgi:hypothetical protein